VKHRVFIYGSCVSRDSYEYFDSTQFELAEYVARQSAISAYTRPVELMAPPLLDSPFQQRMVTGDFQSSLPALIRDTAGSIDLFLVDLTDERLGAYILPDGSVVTRSLELISSGAENSLPPGSHHIPFGSDAHLQYWSQGLETIAALLQTHHPRAGVALLDIPWASTSETGAPTPPSFGVSALEANGMYRPYVDAAARILDAQVVSLDPSEVLSSPQHPWGDAPFHYAERTYREVVSQIMGAPSVPTRTTVAATTRSAPPAAEAKGSARPKAVIHTSIDGGAAQLAHQIEQNGALPKFVHVDTLGVVKSGHNLMVASRQDSRARDLLNYLARNGYYIYTVKDDKTRLVHHDQVRNLWKAVQEKQYQITDDNIVYTYAPPPEGDATQLVVVLASMSPNPFESSINRHFVQNYASIQKQLVPGTGVLRVADLGGVKGAFYLDTTYLPNNSKQISEFIRQFAEGKGIPDSRIVLYGASKGGTGATYHGIANGWNFVAVDPIVDDRLYVEKHNDLHFTTGGIFPRTKEETFHGLLSSVDGARYPEHYSPIVICSERSPQYQTITSTLRGIPTPLTVLNSRNRSIKDHPDVGRQTLQLQATALNSLLTGLNLPSGHFDVP